MLCKPLGLTKRWLLTLHLELWLVTQGKERLLSQTWMFLAKGLFCLYLSHSIYSDFFSFYKMIKLLYFTAKFKILLRSSYFLLYSNRLCICIEINQNMYTATFIERHYSKVLLKSLQNPQNLTRKPTFIKSFKSSPKIYLF